MRFLIDTYGVHIQVICSSVHRFAVCGSLAFFLFFLNSLFALKNQAWEKEKERNPENSIRYDMIPLLLFLLVLVLVLLSFLLFARKTEKRKSLPAWVLLLTVFFGGRGNGDK